MLVPFPTYLSCAKCSINACHCTPNTNRYNHHEEMRCLALRADRPEVLVGTMRASILRFPVPDSIRADQEADAELGVGATLTEVTAEGVVEVGRVGRGGAAGVAGGSGASPGGAGAGAGVAGAGTGVGLGVVGAAEGVLGSRGGSRGTPAGHERASGTSAQVGGDPAAAAGAAAAAAAGVVPKARRTAASVGKFTTQLQLPSTSSKVAAIAASMGAAVRPGYSHHGAPPRVDST